VRRRAFRTLTWATAAAALAVSAAGVLALPAAAAAQERPLYDVRVFARIGPPGQPEPIALGPDGDVFVAANNRDRGDRRAPSKVWRLDAAGRLEREYTIAGQDLAGDHGIQGLAFDGAGQLFALDRAGRARVLVLDPETGDQRDYALFPDVPPCPPGAAAGADCSATLADGPPGPNWPAFAPDGSLYVTDIDQALIWRVPPGGGRAQVWLTDPRLDSLFGPNGIALLPGGRTLVFAQTASNPQAGGDPTAGRLYTVEIRPDGRPGPLRELWRSRSSEGPDGVAVARSGNLYVALAAANQIAVVAPDGGELARFPGSALDNSRQEVPFDGPASTAFLGERLLVTNQSFLAGNPASWAVLDAFVGEPGLALARPRIRVLGPDAIRRRLRVTVSPRSARAGRRTRFAFRVTAAGRPVARARVYFAGRRLRTNRRGRATAVRTLRVRGHRYAVVARRAGYRTGRTRLPLR
jgi:sugar lactone lactonase YvrE